MVGLRTVWGVDVAVRGRGAEVADGCVDGRDEQRDGVGPDEEERVELLREHRHRLRLRAVHHRCDIVAMRFIIGLAMRFGLARRTARGIEKVSLQLILG